MNLQPAAMSSRGARRPARHAARHRRGKGHHVAVAPAGAPIVAAPTFHRLADGSTRISVEVGAKVDVGASHPQGRLVFRLKNAFVIERVNLLPMITTYFATPVGRAQLVTSGPDIDLVIDLRETTTPAHRVVETPRGIVLQVDFPRVAPPDGRDHADSSHARAKRRSTTQSLGNDHDGR